MSQSELFVFLDTWDKSLVTPLSACNWALRREESNEGVCLSSVSLAVTLIFHSLQIFFLLFPSLSFVVVILVFSLILFFLAHKFLHFLVNTFYSTSILFSETLSSVFFYSLFSSSSSSHPLLSLLILPHFPSLPINYYFYDTSLLFLFPLLFLVLHPRRPPTRPPALSPSYTVLIYLYYYF